MHIVSGQPACEPSVCRISAPRVTPAVVRFRALAAIVLLLLCALPLAAATFTVTSPVSGLQEGSLGEAITKANANPGPDTIAFAVGSGPVVIDLIFTPPPITGATIIDGTTQPGYAGTPLVTLDARGENGCLEFTGTAGAEGLSRVEALAIRDCYITPITSRAPINIVGNVLGEPGAESNLGAAITLFGDADGSVVSRNVIGGNGGGIDLQPGVSNVVVTGNFIGVDADGVTPRPNDGAGIVFARAQNITIGGTLPEERNVVSGNEIGIVGNEVENVTVVGNYIGVTGDGAVAVSPAQVLGIIISGSNITVGGIGAARNVVGGNLHTGISITGADAGALIRGNYVGLDATGTYAIPNGAGLAAGGTNVSVTDNVISGNAAFNPLGTGDGLDATIRLGGMISGNLIGTDATGTVAVPNTGAGIDARLSAHTTIRDNVIVASGTDGIQMSGFAPDYISTGVVVQRNSIGVTAAGVAMPNADAGIRIDTGANNNTIGIVTSPEEANVIVSNGGPGIFVTGTATENRLRGNSIHTNGGLGVDLDVYGFEGVTPNDPLDADAGPNGLQNHPRLAHAITQNAEVIVTGVLESTPSTEFIIDFYTSPSADPSGYGEGSTYIESLTVTTDAAGVASFVVHADLVALGTVITATATGPDGTSEFSNAVLVSPLPSIQFGAPSFEAAEDGGSATITVQRSSGLGVSTVNYTTGGGTAAAGEDYEAVNGTLVFNEGQITATFTVPILDDAFTEGEETLALSLASPAGATLGVPSNATLRIVDAEPASVDLRVSKSASPPRVAPYGTVTFTVVVENSGPDTATGVIMTDELPPGTTFVDATTSQGVVTHSAGVVTAALGSIAVGASATVTITAEVGAAPAQLTNTASATANEADASPVSNTSTVAVLVVAEEIPAVTPFGLAILLLGMVMVAMHIVPRT
ncbi:MAG TPA: Calx-beta domain-containing protein [Thermoanaerobaculia bacterium]|jgi:uncharacterized repeat protein (TIGR01451 family)